MSEKADAVAVLILGGLLGFLAGSSCSSKTALNHLSQIKKNATSVEDSIRELEGAVERFDSEDWKSVVPDVRESAQTASEKIKKTQASITEATEALDQVDR